MSILSFIKDIFKPAADLVDNVHTSTEEKLTLRNELAKIEQSVAEKVIDLESKLISAQSSVIIAEAQGSSWLQRMWRPLLMCVFAGLLISTWYYGAPSDVPVDRLFDLLELGIGGYIGGRTIEKVTKTIKG